MDSIEINYYNEEECCNATYHGLHAWFKKMFEHFGWMILADARGHKDKVQQYKHSLVRLKKSLEERMKYMKDVDKKQDLMILHRDLMYLLNHVKIDFPY